jgi:hypothetical protein
MLVAIGSVFAYAPSLSHGSVRSASRAAVSMFDQEVRARASSPAAAPAAERSNSPPPMVPAAAAAAASVA